MSKAPSFQFYAADFLLGTMGMDDAEIGIYIKMLAVQWDRGSLPNCAKTIKKLINSRKLPSENVMRKFSIYEDGMIRNQRLEKERKKQETFRESRTANAKARWDKDSTSNARASGSIPPSTSETDALLSSSSSSLSLARELKAHDAPARSLLPPPAIDQSAFAERLPTEAANDFDGLFARINAIHPSWRKRPAPTFVEMEAALANSKALFAIEHNDWESLKAFYAVASFPPEWEEKAKGGPFWRPESRSRFIQGIADILGHLDRWQANKGKGGKAA